MSLQPIIQPYQHMDNNLISILLSCHMSSCSSPHFMTYGTTPMPIALTVHELWWFQYSTSFAYHGHCNKCLIILPSSLSLNLLSVFFYLLRFKRQQTDGLCLSESMGGLSNGGGPHRLSRILWSCHMSSCSSPHFMTYGTTPMPIALTVHELWCFQYSTSFAYYGHCNKCLIILPSGLSLNLLSVFFYLLWFKRQQTDGLCLNLWAVCPMVEDLIGFFAYCGDLMRLQMSCWILINPVHIIVFSY